MGEPATDNSSDGRWRPLRCRLDQRRDGLWIAPEGELDIGSADMVSARLEEFFVAGFPKVVLDLAGLTFMDSTGLRMIIDAHLAAAAQGVEFAVAPGPPAVQRIFELTGTETLVTSVY
jgi:anti-sigma B factor antagonist